jgi:AcrR family transcriptional regulator
VAGVSVGSLYQYFPSKDSLLSTWLRGMVQTRIAHLRRAVEEGQSESLEAAVARLIDTAIQYRQGPGTERALWAAFMRFGGDELSRAVDAEVIPIFARLLQSHADETRPLDRDLSAFVIFYALRMILTAAGMVPELLAHAPLRDELVRLVVGYVGREPR